MQIQKKIFIICIIITCTTKPGKSDQHYISNKISIIDVKMCFRNSSLMALGGHSARIPIFRLHTWNILNTITLPKCVLGVKDLKFLSRPFDGGSNRFLSILSSNGNLYFYDMQLNRITTKLTSSTEILRFSLSKDAFYVACVASSGTINIYDLSKYVIPKEGNSSKFDARKDHKTPKMCKPRKVDIYNVDEEVLKHVSYKIKLTT